MRVFVYGTLKQGFHNHYLLAAGEFVAEARTEPRFTMFQAQHQMFPMVAEEGNTSITGEVYEINEITLHKLDQLEDHPNWYKRKLINTSEGKAWVYLMPNHHCKNLTKVESGTWR